jgi:hypothetical protein
MERENQAPMRQLPVDLSEIEEIASEREEEEYPEYARSGYVDTQTGQVHIIYRGAFRCIEEEVAEDELEDWVRDCLEAATAIWEDTTGRYEEIKRWESSEEFELMEEFAGRSQNGRLRAELSEALNGRKPFRRFKDALDGWPEAREAWFAFRDHAHRERIRRWLNTLGIEPVDTSSYQPKPVPERW